MSNNTTSTTICLDWISIFSSTKFSLSYETLSLINNISIPKKWNKNLEEKCLEPIQYSILYLNSYWKILFTFCHKHKLNVSLWVLPDLIESVPAGRQSSPGRRNRNMVFSGSVWKYSPSSTLNMQWKYEWVETRVYGYKKFSNLIMSCSFILLPEFHLLPAQLGQALMGLAQLFPSLFFETLHRLRPLMLFVLFSQHSKL